LCGAEVRLADIDSENFNIDINVIPFPYPDLYYDAVIPVDCFGTPNNYTAIKQLFPDSLIIGDNAQGFGTIGIETGMPDMYCTSFHPSKPLNCWGDGGMVFTNNKDYYEKLLSIRNHGKGIDKYHAERVGMNGRMDTIQAAVLREKLKDYPE
jgi:dTDP-4-amino-4,6-dideoxygalactose transaminase